MAEVSWSRILRTISLVLAVGLGGMPVRAQYGGGRGEPNAPYLIHTAAQMSALGAESNDWDKHFRLMADIDLSASGAWPGPIGYHHSATDRKPFTGVFDGNGHLISGFRWNSTDVNYVGLFGYISGVDAQVRNLGLMNPAVEAGTGVLVGALVGYLEEGTITGCCVVGGSVVGQTVVGGLAGSNHGVISSSYATCRVAGQTWVGGLAGDNGACGRGIFCISGTLYDCYATGDVTGTDSPGGLVGFRTSTAFSCFWDVQTSDQPASGGGMGITTAQMQNPDTFREAGWDFFGDGDGPSDVWTIDPQTGYPILWWQVPPAQRPPLPTFAGGAGTADDPYRISSPRQLNSIGHNPRLMESRFILTEDIDFTYADFSFTIGSGAAPFAGVFDGNGKTIRDFDYYWGGREVGLFGCVQGERAQIKNLGLTNPKVNLGEGQMGGALVGHLRRGTLSHCVAVNARVTGAAHLGGLVGRNDLGTLTDCHASAAVTGDYAGGLVGTNADGAIEACGSSGIVTGRYSAGGLLGQNYFGTVANCHSSAAVSSESNAGGLVAFNSGIVHDCYATGDVMGDWHTGGLVGDNSGIIQDCRAAGTVQGQQTVGGLVGMNETRDILDSTNPNCRAGTVTRCSAAAAVTGGDNVGGLVGHNNGGLVTNCHATSTVSGDYATGGLVGTNYNGTIANSYATGAVIGDLYTAGLVGGSDGTVIGCYATGRVTAPGDAGGLVGSPRSGTAEGSFWDVQTSGRQASAGGMGKSTAEMQDPNTFRAAGWDFFGAADGHDDIWTIDPNTGYPALWWEVASAAQPELPAFSGGTGTADDPYLISSAGQLNSIGGNPRLMVSHFRLANDIDLTEINFRSIGTVAAPFEGVFDGDGRTVSHLSCATWGRSGAGFFGYVHSVNAQIRNVTLAAPEVTAGAGNLAGALAGELWGGTLANCHVEGGSVRGHDYVGGLVGRSAFGTMRECHATATLTGEYVLGGLVGKAECDSKVIYCCAGANIHVGSYGAGGLVGYADEATLRDCYAWGTVSGGENVGGLVGLGTRGLVMHCYATGRVEGWPNVGGLLGGDRIDIVGCFWDIQTSGTRDACGSTEPDPPGMAGLTTAEMQKAGPFLNAGWDFAGETANGVEDIWWIDDGQDYPRLGWERNETRNKLE
jgi:hypothetical protein